MRAFAGDIHHHASGIDQRDFGTDAHKCQRSTLHDIHAKAIGQQAHYRGRFHPGDLFQLLLALAERDKKNVAADVGAEDFHHLAMRNVVNAGNFQVVAGINAETPRAGAVSI